MPEIKTWEEIHSSYDKPSIGDLDNQAEVQSVDENKKKESKGSTIALKHLSKEVFNKDNENHVAPLSRHKIKHKILDVSDRQFSLILSEFKKQKHLIQNLSDNLAEEKEKLECIEKDYNKVQKNLAKQLIKRDMVIDLNVLRMKFPEELVTILGESLCAEITKLEFSDVEAFPYAFFSYFPKLKSLKFENCEELERLDLTSLNKGIETLHFGGGLKKLNTLTLKSLAHKNYKFLDGLENSPLAKLSIELDSIEELDSVEKLNIFKKIRIVENLHIKVKGNENLKFIASLFFLKSLTIEAPDTENLDFLNESIYLEEITLVNCKNLQKWEFLFNISTLKTLKVIDCGEINKDQKVLNFCEKLERIKLIGESYSLSLDKDLKKEKKSVDI